MAKKLTEAQKRHVRKKLATQRGVSESSITEVMIYAMAIDSGLISYSDDYDEDCDGGDGGYRYDCGGGYTGGDSGS